MSRILINNSSLLRFNVGFIVNQAIGYSRELPLEIPKITFEEDLVIKNLTGTIMISRTTEGLLVQMNGNGVLNLECVYCLEDFEHNLHFEFVEMYAFPSNALEDVELVLSDDLHIDLTPLIRDYLLLEIPISPICKKDCMGLCPICGEAKNKTNCNHVDENIDDRLSILKTLLDDESPKV